MLARFLLLLVVFVASLASEESQGPFCWAGFDDSGKDKFIPCYQTKTNDLPILNLDTKAFKGLRVCGEDQCVTVSREQFLTALEEWRQAEKRAKP
jgi:hypothetical protein